MAPYVRYANQGATRNLPLDSRLVDAFSFLPEMGLSMEVFSGGQPAKGTSTRRVGSVRHDHGNSADVFFARDGQRLDWSRTNDLPVFQDIVRRAAAAGVTGFGAGPGYMRPGSMHVGFGNPGVWGAGGDGENAPAWLREAFGGAKVAPQAASPVAGAFLAPGAQADAGSAARMLSPTPIAQQGFTPQATAAPFGDIVAPRQVAEIPIAQPGAAPALAGYQRRREAEAQRQAADQQRLAALFGDGMFGPYG